MATKKMRTIELPDYGEDEINLLSQIGVGLEKMTPKQRHRALQFFKGKY